MYGYEGKCVYFFSQRKKYQIWFRHGISAFLEHLSDNGRNTIYIYTHACAVYANRISDFLCRHIRNLRIIVQSFMRPNLKVVPNHFQYVFILEDNTDRWVNNTRNLYAINSINDVNVDVDNHLVAFDMWLHMETRLPRDVVWSIYRFVPPTNITLNRCNHCNAWYGGDRCNICNLGSESETDNSDIFPVYSDDISSEDNDENA